MTAGAALAAENNVSADQILNALRPKTLTRSLSADRPAEPTVQAKEDGFVDSVRNRPSRSLSLGEREQIAELAAAKPKIDLEIRFEYNSARISQASLPAVQELGKALSNPALKGSTFVVAATPMRSEAKPSTRTFRSTVPKRSSNISARSSALPAPTSSPWATARPS